MRANRWREIEQRFAHLVELPSAQRHEQIDVLAGTDPTLARELRSLLAHHDASFALLDEHGTPAQVLATFADPATHGDGATPQSDPLVGRELGAYRIERLLATGGMGRVYLATRADGQFDRTVAVKLIRAGLGGADVERRFVIERHTLATLTHANIARLLDSGVTADGQPFLVMEYVDGEPIDSFCDRNHLDVRARLRLFRSVCDAVQYAHGKLVVHRDLKPSNVLVTADGTVKLLDFGVAKLLARHDGEGVDLTQAWPVHFTPRYASPEQVRGEPVTTASDGYSLGILLYEMLTGEWPYAVTTREPSDVVRAICDAEPIPPSERVAGASPDCANSRRLAGRLRGDLDRIVLMAMRKEPDRRYQSVEQFAQDIDRFLAHRPVIARPDQFTYRCVRFLQRNGLGVLAVALIATSLVIGGGLAAWQWRRAALARDQTQHALDEAREISDFFHQLLESVDPARSGPEARVRDLLDAAAQQSMRRFADQPHVLGSLQRTIGGAYRALGLHEPAEHQLRSALALATSTGADALLRAQLENDLAVVLHAKGSEQEAAAMFEDALTILKGVHGPEHLDVAQTLNNLGVVLRALGRRDAAEARLREALEIRRRLRGSEHPDIAETLNNLAGVYGMARNWEEVEELLRETLAIREQAFDEAHPLLLQSLTNLASVIATRGDPARAEPYAQQAYDTARDTLGAEHPDLADFAGNLGGIRLLLGEREQAEALLRESFELLAKAYAPGDARVLVAQVDLADCLESLGRFAQAQALYDRALTAAPDSTRRERVLLHAMAFHQRRRNLDRVAELKQLAGPGPRAALEEK